MTMPSRLTQRRSFRTGAVAATVVAAATLVAVVLLPWEGFGPFAGASVEPTASTFSQAATATAAPTSTHQPTPSPTSLPTSPAGWAQLSWTQASVSLDCEDCDATINDVIWWEDHYVGVGGLFHFDPDPSGYRVDNIRDFAAAFFTSEDGTEWSVADQGALIDFADYKGVQEYGGVLDTEIPHHLIAMAPGPVAVGGDYVLAGYPKVWASDDGTDWAELDSEAWQETWARGTLVEVAGGASGAVAIGFDGGGCCLAPPGPPTITFSPDGRSWERLDLSDVSSFNERSLLTDVLGYGDGFVITGSAREPDQPRDVEPMPLEIGRPAAWTSTDGRAWMAAEVEGAAVPLGRLSQIAAGSEGLFAIGVAQDPEYEWQASGWASSDGRTWRLLGELGVDLPRIRTLASDGVRITGFGTTTLQSLELAAWSSVDGVEWAPTVLSATTGLPSGDTRYLKPDGTEEYTTGMTALADAWPVPGGLVVAQSLPAPVGGQLVWLATGGGSD